MVRFIYSSGRPKHRTYFSYILSSVAALTLLASCSKSSKTTTGDRQLLAPVALDPNDLRKTKLWLIELTQPYFKTLSNQNAIQMNNAKKELERSVAEIQAGLEVRWKFEVVAVKSSEVWVTNELWSNEDVASAHKSNILLAFDFHPDAEPSELVVSPGLKIGSSITFDRASHLKAGDLLTVMGKLHHIDASWTPHELRGATTNFMRFRIILCNVRVE
jgi:hypothetical protein